VAEEKPFEATQTHLQRAKREGDVARSQDFCAVLAFAGGTAAAAALAAPIGESFRTAIVAASTGQTWAGAASRIGFEALLPFAAAGTSAIAAAALQGGLSLTWPAVKLERLSPGNNLRRIASRETLFGAVRSAASFACAAGAAVASLSAVASTALHNAGPATIAVQAWHGALVAAAAASLLALVFAGGDYFAQVARQRLRLRMSYEEMQRDRKEHDGDPLARSRRRALHRRFARGSLRRVKDAAFVIVNPEHVAVALEYRPPAVAVPRILVRAADETAARVREIAARCGIPIVANVPLARMLYAADAGEFIAPECYAAVAHVVAALYESGALP